MNHFKISCFGLLLVSLVASSCEPPVAEEPLNLSSEFSDYWFNGEAELTSYKLEQARYGEIHPGEAVLIFVTEDFSKEKHVKLDNPGQAGNDVSKILKLNATKKFNTGVYPYSMMESVFTPLNYRPGATHKITASSQEWCGHTFSQMNNRGGQLEISLKSYFESEGDQEFKTEATWLEDELWNTIRLAPEKLPVGDFKIIPSLFYARLSHRDEGAIPATAELSKTDSITTYRLEYASDGRTLSIYFQTDFPYEITGWEESYTSGFGSNAKLLTTRAVQEKRIKLDYWSKNSLADSVWRKQLSVQ